MTKREFKKTVEIYSSHSLKNGFISISYADILGVDTVSTQYTVEVEKIGGALNSLFIHLCK